MVRGSLGVCKGAPDCWALDVGPGEMRLTVEEEKVRLFASSPWMSGQEKDGTGEESMGWETVRSGWQLKGVLVSRRQSAGSGSRKRMCLPQSYAALGRSQAVS